MSLDDVRDVFDREPIELLPPRPGTYQAITDRHRALTDRRQVAPLLAVAATAAVLAGAFGATQLWGGTAEPAPPAAPPTSATRSEAAPPLPDCRAEDLGSQVRYGGTATEGRVRVTLVNNGDVTCETSADDAWTVFRGGDPASFAVASDARYVMDPEVATGPFLEITWRPDIDPASPLNACLTLDRIAMRHEGSAVPVDVTLPFDICAPTTTVTG